MLQRTNYPVLVRRDDRIWHHARIVCSNFDNKTCTVKLDQTRKQIDCDFDQVMPLLSQDGDGAGTSSSSDDDSAIDDYEAVHRAQMIEQSLLNPVADQALGEWERHTKGFGSKMMQKFGYIIGTGLGSDGRGIIVPISAQILPAGRSLDHCMALREAANGDRNLFSVEKKLKQQQRRQEASSARAYERQQTRQVDFFSFMNERIGGGTTSADDKNSDNKKGGSAAATMTTTTTTASKSNNFKDHSSKNLNVAGLKISEEIRRVEREIRKLRESQSRHKSDTPVYGKLQAQLCERGKELDALKKSETSVANEQMFRKDKNKLTIF